MWQRPSPAPVSARCQESTRSSWDCELEVGQVRWHSAVRLDACMRSFIKSCQWDLREEGRVERNGGKNWMDQSTDRCGDKERRGWRTNYKMARGIVGVLTDGLLEIWQWSGGPKKRCKDWALADFRHTYSDMQTVIMSSLWGCWATRG